MFDPPGIARAEARSTGFTGEDEEGGDLSSDGRQRGSGTRVDRASFGPEAPGGAARLHGKVFSFETENREFTRVNTQVPVAFKFFSNFLSDPRLESAYSGITSNLSGGGMLLSCDVPDAAWIPELLLGRVVLGVKINLPGGTPPVKAMARVAWIEDPGRRGEPYRLGLRFREITREGHDRLLGFVIDFRMPE